MTLGFALFSLGTALIYTSFKNMTMADLILGNSAEQPSDVLASVQPFTFGGSAAAGNSTGKGGGDRVQGASNVVGVGQFDGKPVAKWIIPYLEKARKAGIKFTVTSGYRTPAYSESLCYGMCGAPSCDGTCAGKTSNHSGKKFPAGAVDIGGDHTGFGNYMAKIHAPLKNDLPSDLVHFSNSGH